MSLLSYFEWLEASPIGVFVKDQAATFAIIEAVHLMALALLGAAVLSATKCYHNPFYWAKMITLGIGIVFVFAIRAPLLRKDHAQLNPWTLKLMALASMTIWFVVASSGRWIGFSG